MSDNPESPKYIGGLADAIDFDNIRRNAKDLHEASIIIRPDIQAILDRWKTSHNNNRIIGPNRPTPPMRRR